MTNLTDLIFNYRFGPHLPSHDESQANIDPPPSVRQFLNSYIHYLILSRIMTKIDLVRSSSHTKKVKEELEITGQYRILSPEGGDSMESGLLKYFKNYIFSTGWCSDDSGNSGNQQPGLQATSTQASRGFSLLEAG